MKEQMIISVNESVSLVLESSDNINENLGAVPDGCMRMVGLFAVTNVMNNNNRFYTNENYKTMVESMQSRMKSGTIFGQLEHPKSMNVDLDKATHMIESISLDESTGKISGSILLLDTDAGKNMQKLVKRGLNLKISSRGKGVVTESNEVKLSVLETFDLVYRPGFSQAQMSISESVSEDGEKFLFETQCYDLTEKAEDVQIKESILDLTAIKAEIKAELLLESKQPETVMPDLSIVEKFMSEKIEKGIVESETRMQNLLQESMIKYALANQKWIVEQFAPEQVKYMNEHFKAELMSEILESQNDVSKGIQTWVVEDYSKELQKWFVESMNEDFGKKEDKGDVNLDDNATDKKDDKNVDESVKEASNLGDYIIGFWKGGMNDDQEKILKELIGKLKTVKGKVKKDNTLSDLAHELTMTSNDLSKLLDKKMVSESIDESINENAADGLQNQTPKTLLEQIDEQLESITNNAKAEQLIVENANAESEKAVNEALIAENFVMENMPTSVSHLWENSTEEFKTRVKTQAKNRNFVSESQVTRFWISRFTDEAKVQVKENMVKNDKMLTESSPLANYAKMLNS